MHLRVVASRWFDCNYGVHERLLDRISGILKSRQLIGIQGAEFSLIHHAQGYHHRSARWRYELVFKRGDDVVVKATILLAGIQVETLAGRKINRDARRNHTPRVEVVCWTARHINRDLGSPPCWGVGIGIVANDSPPRPATPSLVHL